MEQGQRAIWRRALFVTAGAFLLGSGLLSAQFSFAGPGAATNTGRTATNTAATNATGKTNIVYNPQNEEERRTFMLKAFVENADDRLVRDVVRMFKLPENGDLRELREQLFRYLGLVAVIQDPRKPAEVMIQDVFRSPDLNNNFVVQADEGVHVRSTKDANAGLITLRGDNGNLRIKFKDQTISARLIRLDMKRREIYGEGNATIREKDRVIVGDKFYFNSDSKYGVIYNAQTFMPPYYYFGKKIKKVGEKNYILENGWFSTCDADPPHFGFGVGKAWLYQDTRIVGLDVSYMASSFPVLWLPVLFHPMKGTGFWTGLARDSRVGWFMQVDNVGSMLGLPFEFSFDFYERMGIAMLGGHDIKGKNWSLGIKLGLAYDKPLQQNASGDWVNSVDGYANGESDSTGTYGDWKRDMRWKIELKPSITLLHDENNPALGATTFSFDFGIMSDPFFKGDFEQTRQKGIDLVKIWRQEEVNFFNQGSEQGRSWSLGISDRRGGSSLSVTGNWNFATRINEGANTFANDYKEYRKSSIVFPRISYSFSGNILASSPYANTNLVNTSTNLGKGRNDPLALDDESEKRRSEGDSAVNYSIAYSASIGYELLKTFDEKENVTEQYSKRDLSLSLPLSFSIGTIFSSSLSLGVSDTDQWGDAKTEAQRLTYQKNSRTSINENLSLSVGHIFNKGTLTEIGGRLTASHSAGYRVSSYDDPNDTENALHTHMTTYGLTLNFFRTTATFSTSYDLEEMKNDTRGWGRERFSPLSISITSQPFDFLSITESHTWVIKTDESSYNNLSLSIRSPEFTLPFIEKISGLALNANWSHNYADPRGSNLTLSIGMNVQVSDLWSFTVALSSYNNNLYLYSDEYAAMYGKKSRSFVSDLLNSLMFWDTDRLKDTKFIARSVTFNLIRDLHNWQMIFGAAVNQMQNNTGRKFTYFDMRFDFSISMKSSFGAQMLKMPSHSYRYTADSDGNYYGTYTQSK